MDQNWLFTYLSHENRAILVLLFPGLLIGFQARKIILIQCAIVVVKIMKIAILL